MSVSKLFIDLLGIGFEIYLSMLYYGTFLRIHNVKKRLYILGFSGIVVLNLVAIMLFQNQTLLPLIFIGIIFVLSLYFQASILTRILFAAILSAVMYLSETAMGVIQTRALGLAIENIQSSFIPYIIGVIGSKLLVLVLIYAVRIFIIPKHQEFYSKWFSLSMLAMPLQSLLLCFAVQGFTARESDPVLMLSCELALFVSFAMIAVAAFILNNQMKAMQYKNEYEQARFLLQAQIWHYNDLSLSGQELKAMRHDMKHELLALSGLLEANKVGEALEYIAKAEMRILSNEDIVDTDFPAIDAVINNKVKRAAEAGVTINYKVLIENELLVDQFDMAVILANALDNATEAVLRSSGVGKDVIVVIASRADYISIKIENHTSEAFNKDLKTTKPDKDNHGFGIRQMRIVVEKYDGNLATDFDKDRQLFSLKILLRNQAVSSKH